MGSLVQKTRLHREAFVRNLLAQSPWCPLAGLEFAKQSQIPGWPLASLVQARKTVWGNQPLFNFRRSWRQSLSRGCPRPGWDFAKHSQSRSGRYRCLLLGHQFKPRASVAGIWMVGVELSFSVVCGLKIVEETCESKWRQFRPSRDLGPGLVEPLACARGSECVSETRPRGSAPWAAAAH